MNVPYLSKRLTLHAVRKGRAESNAGLSSNTNRDEQALVVEVVHNVLHAIPFLSYQILAGDLDVVEFDERSPCGDLTRDL